MKKFNSRLAILSLSVVALSARGAGAQEAGPSVTGILGSVQRCEPTSGSTCVDATSANPHPPGVLVSTLNFEDCNADLSYELSVGIAIPSPSYQLEAWVGTQDCSQLANRQSAATSVCWPAGPPQAALTNPFTVNLRMQDIASGAHSTTHPVTYQPADSSACQSPQTAAANVVLYIFFTDGGSNPVGTVQQYPVTFDARAPAILGSIAASTGGNGVQVTVPASSDPDISGYNVYCDPPVTQGAGDVGTSGDAGGSTDAATATCSSAVLSGITGADGGVASTGDAGAGSGGTMVPGLQYGQALGQKYLCGTAGPGATTIDVSEAQMGQSYAVAVATVDSAGNVGPLSNIACGSSGGAAPSYPEGSDDSGGGRMSCSASGAGSPAGSSGLGALLLASIVTLARKRRRA